MLIDYQQTMSYVLLLLFTVGSVLADTGVDDRQKSQNFKVSARIDKGCLLGGGASDTNSFGTISFDNISSLDRNIDAISSKNAGSIVIKCTPNISVSIAIGSGAHASASISSGRYL